MKNVLLKEALPEEANEIESLLFKDQWNDLANQISKLRIIDKCRCGDSFCSSFYSVPKPKGSWGPDYENIVLDSEEGDFILDIVDGKIVYVEILHRKDIKSTLNKVIK